MDPINWWESYGSTTPESVKCKDSYNSIESRIAAYSLMPGNYMGEVNHSKAFPPAFVRTMAGLLQQGFCGYLTEQVSLIIKMIHT